jgi:hypothetical protein
MVDYGYGFQAIRDNGRGGQSIGILIQINLIPAANEYYNPGENMFLRGMDRFIRSFN